MLTNDKADTVFSWWKQIPDEYKYIDELLSKIVGERDTASYEYTLLITRIVQDGVGQRCNQDYNLEWKLYEYLSDMYKYIEHIRDNCGYENTTNILIDRYFTAYYMLSLIYKRLKKYRNLKELYRRYQGCFRNYKEFYPLLGELKSRYHCLPGATVSDYKQALEADSEALMLLDQMGVDNEGVKISFCTSVLNILESSEVNSYVSILDDMDIETAWRYCCDALEKNRTYAKYYSIKARLLLFGKSEVIRCIRFKEFKNVRESYVREELGEIRGLLQTAIYNENSESADYLIRISEYEKYLLKCDTIYYQWSVISKVRSEQDEVSSKLNYRIEEAKSVIDKNIKGMYNHFFEMIVIITGVLSLIIGTFHFTNGFSYINAALLLIELVLCLLLVYMVIKFTIEFTKRDDDNSGAINGTANKSDLSNYRLIYPKIICVLIVLLIITVMIGFITNT